MAKKKYKKKFSVVSVFLIMVVVFIWSYCFNDRALDYQKVQEIVKIGVRII